MKTGSPFCKTLLTNTFIIRQGLTIQLGRKVHVTRPVILILKIVLHKQRPVPVPLFLQIQSVRRRTQIMVICDIRTLLLYLNQAQPVAIYLTLPLPFALQLLVLNCTTRSHQILKWVVSDKTYSKRTCLSLFSVQIDHLSLYIVRGRSLTEKPKVF